MKRHHGQPSGKQLFGHMHRGGQDGFVAILALLVTVSIMVFIMYKYFDANPETGKSAMDQDRAAIDSANNVQVQAEARAKATNDMMNAGN